MKNTKNIIEICNNIDLKNLSVESYDLWLRAKIVIQFIYLREKLGYTQEQVATIMGVKRQQITRFENMNNSPTIYFLVKYANALNADLDILLKGIGLTEVHNESKI